MTGQKNARHPEEHASATTSADSTSNDIRETDRPLYLPLTWSKTTKRDRLPRGKHRRNTRRKLASKKRGER